VVELTLTVTAGLRFKTGGPLYERRAHLGQNMKLIEEYVRQPSYRNWSEYISELPFDNSQTVLDLGCSIGTVSNLISERVNKVISVDNNLELLKYAENNSKSNILFIHDDLNAFDFHHLGAFNGAWISFVLAYINKPITFLKSIHTCMDDCGWIALVDINNFISGNMNPKSKYYDLVLQFEKSSFRNKEYDFNVGSKLVNYLNQVGFSIFFENHNCRDDELNFSGKASEDVVIIWKARLDRMANLSKYIGSKYKHFSNEFIDYISSREHHSDHCVHFVIGMK